MRATRSCRTPHVPPRQQQKTALRAGPLLQSRERTHVHRHRHMPFLPPNLRFRSTKYARPTALNQLRE